MANKTLKTLGTLLLLGLGINSFAQDTIRTAEGYTIKNKQGYVAEDVKKGKDWKEVYEYDNGKLIRATTFSKGLKTKLYTYNKGHLLTETIYNKDGKIKEVIDRKDFP